MFTHYYWFILDCMEQRKTLLSQDPLRLLSCPLTSGERGQQSQNITSRGRCAQN